MKPKLPIPRIRPEQILGFLLRHVEKFVVVLLALLGLWLTWGGIAAARTQSVTTGLRVDEVENLAVAAERHIGAERQVPADWLPTPAALAVAVDQWRLAQPAAPGPLTPLDRPLTGELAGRTKPEILPLEELHAVACLAVVKFKPGEEPAVPPGSAVSPTPGPPAGAAPRPPAATAPSGPPWQKPRRPGAREPLKPEGPEPEAAPAPTVREFDIKPFVVVTGLIPVERQRDEYRLRYSQVRFREPRRDSPWWCDYVIERLTVLPDQPEQWEPIDLAAARKLQDSWGPVPDPVGPDSRLQPLDDGRSEKTTPLPFCGPLPPRIDQEWGTEAFHPWFVTRLRTALPPAAQAPAPPSAPNLPPDMQPPSATAAPALPPAPYALLRFVDANVEPGRSYRYRVRLRVWNPNFNLPRQQLADPGLATQAKLTSPDSVASTPVTIPLDRSTLLVEPTVSAKKPGQIEMLVLGPSERTGGYALRGVLADPGAAVNVGEGGDGRARGEPLSTPYLVVDARPRPEAAEGKTSGTPEPLEVLVLHQDGRFEVVSAADSQASIDRYRSTLPAPGPVGEAKGKPATDGPPTTFNPFQLQPPGPK